MKFLALDQTQLFLLEQWANGKFESKYDYKEYPVNHLDAASVGNCVGLPMCPGIEVTWSMQNPIIYQKPYHILQHSDEAGYFKNGLTPSRDECEGGGCEPGDLTKRMACPWQADFFQCTIQYINFTNSSVNKANSTPLPPTYYSYWWPPQSPWDVLVGELTAVGQSLNGNIPAGQQMNYARGINSFTQMVQYWYALGFIKDVNAGNSGFPYMLETERNNELFTCEEMPVSKVSGNKDDDETTIPVFYIESDKSKVKAKSLKAQSLVEHFEVLSFKAIDVHNQGLGIPRSGTRSRR
jgi:L-lysine 6-oxidase